ncbi:MAG: hypothetical protein NTX53_09250 [candidate division WOR-3 bacterium]|nr:hypothetical protein [candidate division WOR-3 bacterium]
MTCFESLSVWTAVASALSATVGLLLTAKALRANTIQRNLDLFVKYYQRVVDAADRMTQAGDPKEHRRLVFGLGVELEGFAFLVNNGYLNDRKMIDFWKPTLLGWHEELFPPRIPDWSDPKNYVEFKKLCRSLKVSENNMPDVDSRHGTTG